MLLHVCPQRHTLSAQSHLQTAYQCITDRGSFLRAFSVLGLGFSLCMVWFSVPAKCNTEDFMPLGVRV